MKTKLTGYKDRFGKPIRYGDKVRRTVSSPWDEQVPITLTFIINRDYGGAWMEGIESNFEDDFLKHHAPDCEIVSKI